MDTEVQTRTEEGDLAYYPTVREAFAAAKADPTIWKISFDAPSGERIRLVRREVHAMGDPKLTEVFWAYESLEEEMEKAKAGIGTA